MDFLNKVLKLVCTQNCYKIICEHLCIKITENQEKKEK